MNLGLAVEQQVVMFDRVPQISEEHQAALVVLVQRSGIEGNARAAELGLTQRHIAAPNQLIGFGSVPGEERDADADARFDHEARQLDWLSESLEQNFRSAGRILSAAMRQQYGE